MSLFDSMGEAHSVTLTFERQGDPSDPTKSLTFDVKVTTTDDSIDDLGGVDGDDVIETITFDAEGRIASRGNSMTELTLELNNGASDIVIAADDMTFNEDKFT
jgi:hypothetical protein